MIVGLECGSSDAFSGLTANPAVGEAADIIVGAGGTVVLSEVTEMVGAEPVLERRGKTDAIKTELMTLIKKYEIELSMTTEDDSGVFISPGNIEGGLTTIEEKSLGCIYKAGTHPVVQIVDYGEVPTEKGVVIMDTPGFDIASVTGKVAGGAHIVFFTTGKGTPTGSSIAPVVKVSSNNTTFEAMEDDIDISAGDVLEGKKTLKEVGRELGRSPDGNRQRQAGEGRGLQYSGIRHSECQRGQERGHSPAARRTEETWRPGNEASLYVRGLRRRAPQGHGHPGRSGTDAGEDP